LGVCTTSNPKFIDAVLDLFGPERKAKFDFVHAGDVVAKKKPAPDIYRLALSTLGLGPANAVAVEDSANGLAAAKAAGLFTVVTPTRWTALQDFGEADLTLPHLGDPAMPLDAVSSGRAGGPFLTLEALARLHARAAARAA
jgi:beta-phosphoglucomutase-like phosphatase (HAD superfamily)